ncbi:MAG: hypothetical protein IKD03_03220, partial [Clostridia bacterium]|nr:hypothetical protein [Clostridia bacterium]
VGNPDMGLYEWCGFPVKGGYFGKSVGGKEAWCGEDRPVNPEFFWYRLFVCRYKDSYCAPVHLSAFLIIIYKFVRVN